MLLWITLGVFVISLILTIKLWDNFLSPWLAGLIGGALAVSGIATIVMAVILCCNWFDVDGAVAALHAQAHDLEYRYDAANWLVRDNVAQEIQKWNKDLAWNKKMQDNFWIDPFIPNVYDQFDIIEFGGDRS